MKPELSIIIPCFNCSKTLAEAVDSCYTQGLIENGNSFEIVMVDDGSTDTTCDVMKKLLEKYTANTRGNIRYFFHEKNMGGGAARNTAVAHAYADIIFCLDSDDILPPETLSKMLAFMLGKRKAGKECDGVGVQYSKKFRGKNTTDIEYMDTFSYEGEIIPFESLFQKNNIRCPLYSTFMHTREAFDIAGGYPENHGFDTQAFAWRFLANGLVAYTCPDAEYFHRIHFNKSYYLREYESGKVNYNWFLILSEFLYIFSNSAKDLILGFNIHSDKNMFDELCKESTPLTANYTKYVKKETKKYKSAEIVSSAVDDITKYDAYWLADRYSKENMYPEAFHYFSIAYKKGLRSPEQFRKTMSAVIDKGDRGINLVTIIPEIIERKDFKKRGAAAPFMVRVIRKLRKIIKANGIAYELAVRMYWLYQNIKNYATEGPRKRTYRASIEKIKKDKRIVVDLKFGGIGDCLVWSTLPRLLKEKYDIDFYLSKRSLQAIQNKDIYKLCFEINPHFRGVTEDGPYFSFDTFESEKSLLTFLTSIAGKTVIEILERQFKLIGNGKPELYYTPNRIDKYQNMIFIDKNSVTGKKLGWKFKKNAFEDEALRHKSSGDQIEYVDPSKQDLFGYVDLIYSCKYFICTFSGGASLAACFNKPFSVIWPLHTKNGSNYQFRYKKSAGKYL